MSNNRKIDIYKNCEITRTPEKSPTPTRTTTKTPKVTRTATKSLTPTRTVTKSITPTRTVTKSPTPTITPTVTRTPTPTITPTITKTPTRTPTPTITVSATQTITPTISITPTRTITPTITVSVTQTVTPTITTSVTPTITRTNDFTPFSIIWNLSYTGIVGGSSPWIVSNNNKRIRYNVENSLNCGGINSNIQTGTAVANIFTGSFDGNMNIDFSGIGEAQSSGFEKISFYLDDVLVGAGNAPGGGQGCVMGPIVKTPSIILPIKLQANRNYVFRINFSTVDPLFHVNAYYVVDLSFI